jgi:hypothetical protein
MYWSGKRILSGCAGLAFTSPAGYGDVKVVRKFRDELQASHYRRQ